MAIAPFGLTISGFAAGQFFQNVMSYDVDDSSSSSDFELAAALAQAWIADVLPTYLDSLPTIVMTTSLRVWRRPDGAAPAGGPAVTITTGVAGEFGTRSGGISTTVIGPVLIFPFMTASTTRTGKMFLPTVSETDVEDNAFSTSLLTQLDTLRDSLITILSLPPASTAKFCIWSPKDSQNYEPVGAYTSTVVGVQRRRNRPRY